jgi:hypothetical protein
MTLLDVAATASAADGPAFASAPALVADDAAVPAPFALDNTVGAGAAATSASEVDVGASVIVGAGAGVEATAALAPGI